MTHPILHRELVGLLRTRKALAIQVGAVLAYALLLVARWPTDALVGISGEQAQEVFRLFGYGLTAIVMLIVPAFSATSLVREKNQGTLALLVNTPMRPWSLYFNKLLGVLGFALILLALGLPAAAACYAMGGLSLGRHVLVLYAIVVAAALQACALGLLVSSRASSSDSALRVTYGLLLVVWVMTLGPHLFLQSKPGPWPQAAEWLRCASPIPAVMEVLGQSDVASQGLSSSSDVPARFLLIGLAMAAACAAGTVARLSGTLFDRPRPPGTITDDRSWPARWLRRLLFVVDPQRRKRGIAWPWNPVMVKEFRSRRFGRSHWMLRLVAACAVLSLGLTYAATLGTFDWGPETIGGIMVLFQVALVVLLTPALAATLVSGERERGGWTLLQMTPLSPGAILRGKLLSVVWPMALLLAATLPGYLVMIAIQPTLWPQISRVLTSLALTALFALLLSTAVGSLFRRTAVSITAAYVVLAGLFAGTMLVWLGRGAPFGHSTVEAALRVNPLAATLGLIHAPGFTDYDLVPANWWFLGGASAVSLGVLVVQTWRLSRPQ